MMIPGNTLMTKPHPLWEACKGKTFQVKAATARARMLVGRFQLQTTRARFSKVPMSMECPICETEDEDIVHFLCRCPKLEAERHQRMKDFKALFTQEGLEEPRTDEELASALLNGGIFRVLVGSRHKYSVEGQPMVTKTVTLVKNMVTAQQLPNLICYKPPETLYIQKFNYSPQSRFSGLSGMNSPDEEEATTTRGIKKMIETAVQCEPY